MAAMRFGPPVALALLGLSAPAAAQQASGGERLFAGPEEIIDHSELEPGWPLSLAARHYIWLRSAVVPERWQGVPLDTTVRCAPFSHDSTNYGDCHATGVAGVAANQQAPLLALINRYLDTASYRVSMAATQQLLAHDTSAALVVMRLSVDDFLPLQDTVEERAMPLSQAVAGSRFAERIQLNYPPQAVRGGWQGRLELTCLIYSDRSVGCEALSMDPPDNFAFFRDLIERQSTRIRMPERLADGSASAGARFPARLVYALP